MSEKAPRPQVVGSACLFIGMLSGLLLFFVITWLTSWNSLEQQEALADIAESMRFSDVEQFSSVLRIVLLGYIVILVCGVVGSIYARRGDRASRALITVVAVAAAIAFVVGGGLLGLIPAMFVMSSLFQLWSREANRWFKVVNGQPVPPEPVALAAPARPMSAAQPTSTVPPPPGPTVGGTPPPPPMTWTPPARRARPSSVSTVVLVTALSAGAALGGGVFFLGLYFLVPHDELIAVQLESPVYNWIEASETQLRQALQQTAVFSGIAVVLSAAALIAVWLFHRGRPSGHLALTVLSVVTVVFGVFTVVGAPWAGAAVWVFILLRRREVADWLNQRRQKASDQQD